MASISARFFLCSSSSRLKQVSQIPELDCGGFCSSFFGQCGQVLVSIIFSFYRQRYNLCLSKLRLWCLQSRMRYDYRIIDAKLCEKVRGQERYFYHFHLRHLTYTCGGVLSVCITDQTSVLLFGSSSSSFMHFDGLATDFFRHPFEQSSHSAQTHKNRLCGDKCSQCGLDITTSFVKGMYKLSIPFC
jgi:hypothetical protein